MGQERRDLRGAGFRHERVPVVVVGAGVSGLAAAHRLRELNVDFVLLERSSRCGGVVLTEHLEGFLLEGGPDSFLAAKPWAADLCRRVGLADEIIPTDRANRGAFILHHGRLHPLPEGLTSLVPTRWAPLLRTRLLSPAGKARLALEPLVPPRFDQEDESLASFFRRRFGSEASRRLVEPLVRGIYGGAPERLSLQATFPRLAAIERRHGSLIRGLLAEGRQRAAEGISQDQPEAGFLSLARGMGSLVDRLVATLPAASVRLGAAVRAVYPRQSGISEVALHTGERLVADVVLLTTPAAEAAHLVGSNDWALALLLSDIRSGASLTVALAFARSQVRHPLRGHGFVVPEAAGAPLLACTWSSSKFPGRAPEGCVLLRAFLARPHTFSGAHDGGIVEAAQRTLRPILGIEGAPRLAVVHRWSQALPRYPVGHPQRVAEIERRLESWPGLLLAGASYRGLGVPDCIHDGERAGEAAARFLGMGTPPTPTTSSAPPPPSPPPPPPVPPA